jgi:hypothetical protein
MPGNLRRGRLPSRPAVPKTILLPIAAAARAARPFSSLLGEMHEMRVQWNRPYRVDASKIGGAFWSDATPFEARVRETALSFRVDAGSGRARTPGASNARGSERQVTESFNEAASVRST